MQNQQHFFSSSSSQRKETLSSEDGIFLLSVGTVGIHRQIPYIFLLLLFSVCLRQGVVSSKLALNSL